jgi:hypothetical protein
MLSHEMILHLAAIIIAAVVVGTSAFVYVDATLLGMPHKRAKDDHLLNQTPLWWFGGCMCLWIVVFPMYFVARYEFIHRESI